MDTFRCGDPKEGENVVINSLGYPECRICRNRRNREWAARRRAKIRAELRREHGLSPVAA